MALLVGAQTRLRPFEKEDIPLKVKWINDADVHQELHYEVPLSLSRTERWYANAVMDQTRRDFIIESHEGRPVGLTGLLDIHRINRTAEVFVTIGEKDWWGKGIGTEVESLMCEWGFEVLDLYKITGGIRTTNIACIKMSQKIGFQVEGTLRQHRFIGGKRVDVVVVGLLRDEFKPYVPRKK